MKNIKPLIVFDLFLTFLLLSYFSYYQASIDSEPSPQEIATMVEEASKNLPPGEAASVGYAIVRTPFIPPSPDLDYDDRRTEPIFVFLNVISAIAILNQVRKTCSIQGRGRPKEYFPKIFCLK